MKFLRVLETSKTQSGCWEARVLFERDGQERSEFFKFQTKPTADEIEGMARVRAAAEVIRELQAVVDAPQVGLPVVAPPKQGLLARIARALIRFLGRWT